MLSSCASLNRNQLLKEMLLRDNYFFKVKDICVTCLAVFGMVTDLSNDSGMTNFPNFCWRKIEARMMQ